MPLLAVSTTSGCRRGTEYAGLFEHAELAVQPGVGHFPWLDDTAWFTRTLRFSRLTASNSSVAATVAPSVATARVCARFIAVICRTHVIE